MDNIEIKPKPDYSEKAAEVYDYLEQASLKSSALLYLEEVLNNAFKQGAETAMNILATEQPFTIEFEDDFKTILSVENQARKLLDSLTELRLRQQPRFELIANKFQPKPINPKEVSIIKR